MAGCLIGRCKHLWAARLPSVAVSKRCGWRLSAVAVLWDLLRPWVAAQLGNIECPQQGAS
jgi:hypothetical protein